MKTRTTKTLTNCDFFNPLNGRIPRDQGIWLRQNSAAASHPDHDDCRLSLHAMSETDFDLALRRYWNKRVPKFSHFTLEYILAKGSLADEYNLWIKAVADAAETISLSSTSVFTTDQSCFSMPLFHTLRRRHGLSNGAIFSFTLGIVDGNRSVLFIVPNISDGYFDYSHNPPLVWRVMAV